MAEQLNRTARLRMTQGSGDAFVQGSISTGLSAAVPMGMVIKDWCIDIAFPNSFMAVGTDFALEFSMTRASKTAIGALSDPDTVGRWACVGALTTSGMIFMPTTISVPMPNGTIIVQDTLYFQGDSGGSGLTMTFDMLINYELVKLSETDFLRLLAAQP